MPIPVFFCAPIGRRPHRGVFSSWPLAEISVYEKDANIDIMMKPGTVGIRAHFENKKAALVKLHGGG
ncbi:MAG: hypothetical protein CMI63_18075 [Parvularcula sp.]|nr:hypothetical protein [Parvularcula sp.]